MKLLLLDDENVQNEKQFINLGILVSLVDLCLSLNVYAHVISCNCNKLSGSVISNEINNIQ